MARPGQPEKKERNDAMADIIKCTDLSYAEIGNLFGVSKQAVGKIAKRKGVARSGNSPEASPKQRHAVLNV